MRIDRIKEILSKALPTVHLLTVEDESHKHSGRKGTESHFKVTIISDFFNDQSRIKRQQFINSLLKEEFTNGLHALSLKILTIKESQTSTTHTTPNCAIKK